MGRRGPAAKPTALRLLHGDRKDRVAIGEPQPAPGPPRCPPDLPAAAKREWARLVRECAPGVLTRADRQLLAQTATLAAEEHRLAEVLANSAPVIPVYGPSEDPEHPEDRVVVGFVENKTLVSYVRVVGHLRQHLREFGLTPSARADLGRRPETGRGADAYFGG